MLVLIVLAGASAAPALDGLGQTLLDLINRERDRAGLPPLSPHPALESVADQEAEAVAVTRSLRRTPDDIMSTGRDLRRAGYTFHRWKQRFVVGEGRPERLLGSWRKEARADYEATVLGDYEHLGIGQSRMPGGNPILTIMVALPRSTIFYREAATLDDLDAVREEVLERTNALRHAAERPPLTADAVLDAVAQVYAEELRRTGRYSHLSERNTRPGERVGAAGYEYRWVAENLAKGLFGPTEVVDRWNDSSGHRENMLARQASDLGVGVAYGETAGKLDVIWVMVLARR